MKTSKILFIPILLGFALTGCSGTPSESGEKKLSNLYTSLKAHNWTATNSEGTFEFLGESALNTAFKKTPDIQGGLFKNSQGVFEYAILDGKVEVQGMYSPNTELSIYNFLTSPADLLYIEEGLWNVKSSKLFELNMIEARRSKNSRSVLYAINSSLSTNVNSIAYIKGAKLSITKDGADFTVSISSGEQITEETMNITKIGKTKNDTVSNFLSIHTTIEKLTDWTSYQKSIFRSHEIPDPYFYSGYSVGLTASLGYLNDLGLIFAYDCLSNADHVDSLKDELEKDGYEYIKSSSTSVTYEKNDTVSGINYGVEFGFVSYEDFDNPLDKECYPNGYLLVIYRFGKAHEDSSLEEVNTKLKELGVSEISDPDNLISEVTSTDYTSFIDAEYKEIFEESGIEIEGEHLVLLSLSIQFKVSSFENAQTLVTSIKDQIMSSFYNDNYVTSQILGLEYTGKTEIDFDTIPSMNNAYYAKGGVIYEDTNLLYIEVYDYDYENNNSVNMTIEIYTKEFLENI